MRLVAALLVLAGAAAAGDFERIGQQALADFNQQRYPSALRGFQQLKQLQPDNHEILVAIAQTLQAMGDMQGALDELQAAAGVLGHRNPKVWEIYVKIGDLLKAAGDYTQALRAYDAALDVSPNQVSAFTQRGILNQEFDAYEKAEKDFESAVQLDPTNPQAWSGLGIAWMYLEHALPDGKPKGYDSYDEGSIFALRRVMSLQPKDMVTLSNLVMAENRVCDWSYKKEHEKAMKQALRERASRKENFAPPFHAFEFGYSPKELLVNSKYLSKRISESVQHRRKLVPPNPAAANLTSSHKLRIGYVNGAGFRNSTTTARCLQSMFKHHSKTVEIFCYALSSDDGSRERSSIQTSCDGGWVEGSRLTDDELAAQVSKDEIHILVDTTGYTMKQRTEIFALSRAPIVLSFHGFPGTMAAKVTGAEKIARERECSEKVDEQIHGTMTEKENTRGGGGEREGEFGTEVTCSLCITCLPTDSLHLPSINPTTPRSWRSCPTVISSMIINRAGRRLRQQLNKSPGQNLASMRTISSSRLSTSSTRSSPRYSKFGCES